MKTLSIPQQKVIFQKELWKLIRQFAAEFDLDFSDMLAILELTKLDLYRMEVLKIQREQG